MRNWISSHQRVLIFAVIFALLGFIRFIPPYEPIFIGQRLIEAVAQVIHGFANLLIVFGRLLPEPLWIIGYFCILFIFGTLYGLILIRLWKWRVWLGKFLVLIFFLINTLLGLFIVNASDTLVGKSYATCNKEISDTVAVRIVSYPEIGWIAGSHQFYSISSDEGKTWHQFIHFRHDDPIRPGCEKIKSSTSNHIWVWTNSIVAVTENTGNDWHIWHLQSFGPDWMYCERCLVEKVTFQDTKIGSMQLSPIYDEGESIFLHTQDGGETWE